MVGRGGFEPPTNWLKAAELPCFKELQSGALVSYKFSFPATLARFRVASRSMSLRPSAPQMLARIDHEDQLEN